MDLILFLAGIFIVTFFLGKLLEKKHIPWIFSALIIGLILSANNPFSEITSSPSFLFLAELGMFFLLFIIGFELKITSIFRQGSFIFQTTTAIIFAETVLGALLIHYVFGVSWLISTLVALSFATVGESLLLPILDEFKLVKTKLGQTILGVGVLDDIFEILTVIIASVVIGRGAGYTHLNIWTNVLILGALFGIVFIFIKFHKKIHVFKFKDIPSFFLFIIFFIFLFIGIGRFVESAALGALLAGIALRNIVPEKRLKFIDSEIRTMSYGFFAPVFFLWVGLNTNIGYVFDHYVLVLMIVAITAVAKLGPTYFLSKKIFGAKKSVILGTGLMVKLSTSIVIIKLLFENGLIGSELYSVLIASTVIFSLFVPIMLSYLLKRWKIGFTRARKSLA